MQLKNQEKELEAILEEKMVQMERDYVKGTLHEQIVQEKNDIIERLKSEMERKEGEFRLELNGRLRTLEDRLTQENESVEGTYKGKKEKWMG